MGQLLASLRTPDGQWRKNVEIARQLLHAARSCRHGLEGARNPLGADRRPLPQEAEFHAGGAGAGPGDAGRFDEFFDRMRSIDRAGDGSEAELAVSTAAAAFSSAIADDLNISEALAAMFELLRSGNKLADAGGLSKAGAERILGRVPPFRLRDRRA